MGLMGWDWEGQGWDDLPRSQECRELILCVAFPRPRELILCDADDLIQTVAAVASDVKE